MSNTRRIEIEHRVIASIQPYEKVLDGLKKRLGSVESWQEAAQRLQATPPAHSSWERVSEVIESTLGSSGFLLFSVTGHTPLLRLMGKISRAIQYIVGNPLLAVQMSQFLPEVALYAPLRLVVYEDESGKTFVAYDDFVSLLAQYQHEAVSKVAQIVEQKLEALLTEVTQ